MARLSISTISIGVLCIISLLLLPKTTAKPSLLTTTTTTTTVAPTTHFISFLSPRKPNKNHISTNTEFDFEPISNGKTTGTSTEANIASVQLEQLFGSLVQQIEMDVQNNFTLEEVEDDLKKSTNITDDLPVESLNTLDAMNDEMFKTNEQHESSWNDQEKDRWNRIKKQGIPVLEPVKHLLNTVRDGGLNHTSSRHHHLLGGAEHNSNSTESAAIETEEDRETVIESTGFNFLELLGSIGGMAWGVLTNIQKLFAASSGSASAASSSSSSGGR